MSAIPSGVVFAAELRGSASAEQLLGQLCEARLDPTAPEDRDGAAVLVFFRELGEDTLAAVSELSRFGLVRLVACAVGRMPSQAPWRLLRAGASDVVEWAEDGSTAPQLRARIERWAAVDATLASPVVRKNLVGQSRAWVLALRDIVDLAKFSDAPALILGESGTGKELAARLIHTLDQRPDKKDLVVVDCTTIVPQLAGSEFFGHEKGAFTSAATARDGAFALADGGTLFLDEIGELPLELQAQLLRVVQERTFKRVGGNTWQNTHFRLVCATHRDLLQDVQSGRFRRDLYYRIASATTRLPSLAERTDDILVLARHFLGVATSGEACDFDEHLREYLVKRRYAGNVRDLRQLVLRIAQRRVSGAAVTVGSLPPDERPIDDMELSWHDERLEDVIRQALALGAGLKDIGRTAEDVAVRIAVESSEGNLRRAATRLGVTDRALQLRRAARRTAD